jgi:transcription initiation factor TFIIB
MISSRKSNSKELVLEVPQQIPSGHSHGPLITDAIRGEVLCASCGAVVLDKVEDSGPEQRSFTMEDYNNRSRSGHGSTLSLHDQGLSTIIDAKDKDALGNRLSSDMKTIFQRLRTWDSRSRSNNEDRNLRSAFGLLEMLKSRLELSDAIKERTAYIYRKAISQRMTSGRSIVGILAASLYTACREMGAPRTLDDIAKAANLKVKELSRDQNSCHKAGSSPPLIRFI